MFSPLVGNDDDDAGLLVFWVAEHEPYKENTEAEIEPHRSSAAPAGTSCGESTQSSGSFEKKS